LGKETEAEKPAHEKNPSLIFEKEKKAKKNKRGGGGGKTGGTGDGIRIFTLCAQLGARGKNCLGAGDIVSGYMKKMIHPEKGGG